MEPLFYSAAVSLIIFLLAKLFALKICREDNCIKTEPKNLPAGYKLFYSDQKSGNKEDGVIYSLVLKCKSLDITGKPDYIYKKSRKNIFIPVEIKSGSIGSETMPYPGDLMQLAAYFAIIEENLGLISEGRIVYSDFMFTVKNTKRLNRRLVLLLNDMREMLNSGEGKAASSYPLCKNCVCNGTVCEYFTVN